MPLDAIRERLARCRYTCHQYAGDGSSACAYCELDEWQHHYKADVSALLALLEGKDAADVR